MTTIILFPWSCAHNNVVKDSYTTPYGCVMRSANYMSYRGMNAVLPPAETLVYPSVYVISRCPVLNTLIQSHLLLYYRVSSLPPCSPQRRDVGHYRDQQPSAT